LANDFLSLGFIPEGIDIQSVSDALQASFGDGTRHSRDFEVCTCSSCSLVYIHTKKKKKKKRGEEFM
jgi:aarF domain-containing kinase